MTKIFPNATPEYDASTLGTDGSLTLTYPNYAQPFSTWVAEGMAEVGIPHIPGFTSGVLNGSGWLINTIDHATGFRESSEAAFLRPFLSRPNLVVYNVTLAEKIVFKGNMAKGVQVSSRNKTFTVSARKEVILSAGVFQSPQLLLVSGVGPVDLLKEHGIKVIANRPGVGQNMHDHIFFGISYKVKVPTANALADPAVFKNAVDQFNNEQAGPLSSPGGNYAGYENVPLVFRTNFSESTVEGKMERSKGGVIYFDSGLLRRCILTWRHEM
jgi:choline dehydrogenase